MCDKRRLTIKSYLHLFLIEYAYYSKFLSIFITYIVIYKIQHYKKNQNCFRQQQQIYIFSKKKI